MQRITPKNMFKSASENGRMLPLDDRRWSEYTNAMGAREDVAPILRQLLHSGASPQIWDACWNCLVYQGDVGQASYAAVPYLAAFIRNSPQIDWNALALVAVIELGRPSGPAMPEELEIEYRETIQSLPVLLAHHPHTSWDELTTRCAVSCMALARGQQQLAKFYLEFSLDEAIAWLNSRND